MKKVFAPVLALALIFSAFIALSPRHAEAQTQNVVSVVLQRMENNYNTLKNLKSGIQMRKYNAQTRDAEDYAGYLHYVPGKGRSGNARLDWYQPAQETLAVKNGSYKLYRPKLNVVYVGTVDKKQKSNPNSSLNFLNMSGSQLRSQFNVQFVGNEDTGVGMASKLYLTPKGNASYQSAEVWVDGNGMPIQIKVNEKNNDYTFIRVYQVERNANFDGSVFDLQIPKTAKTVKG
jgi:outer membrane lipoprotein-sorting protein